MTFFDYLTHHALQHAIPAAGGALVAWLVARWPQKPPPFDAEFGSIVVRHGWGFKALSLVLFVVLGGPALLFASAFLRDPEIIGRSAGFLLVIPILIFALAVYLLAQAFRARIDITPAGLYGSSPWRGRQVIRWEDVASVSYSYVFDWFVIRGPDGQKICAHVFLKGLPWLGQAVQRYLPPTVYAQAAKNIEWQARQAT